MAEQAGKVVAPNQLSYPVPGADGTTIDRDNQVILVRFQGKVYAFALACPHENTALRWRAQDSRFQCPRHESKYQPDGTFVEGRATRNMDRYAIKRQGGEVIVDLTQLFHSDQQQPQWAAAVAGAWPRPTSRCSSRNGSSVSTTIARRSPDRPACQPRVISVDGGAHHASCEGPGVGAPYRAHRLVLRALPHRPDHVVGPAAVRHADSPLAVVSKSARRSDRGCGGRRLPRRIERPGHLASQVLQVPTRLAVRRTGQGRLRGRINGFQLAAEQGTVVVRARLRRVDA